MSVKSGNASIRDQTQEFQGIAERVRKSISSQNGLSSSGSKREEPPRSEVAMQSEFNRRASKIGLGIHQTSQKLTKLAKRELLRISNIIILDVVFWLKFFECWTLLVGILG